MKKKSSKKAKEESALEVIGFFAVIIAALCVAGYIGGIFFALGIDTVV